MQRPGRARGRRGSSAQPLEALQQTLGNRAFGSLIQRWASLGMYAAKAAKTPYAVCTLEGGPVLGKKKRSFDVHGYMWLPKQHVGSVWGREEPDEKRPVAFAVTKDMDDLSALLFKAATDGSVIDTLELSLAGGKGVLRFSGVLVTGVHPAGGNAGDEPREQIVFEGVLVSTTFQQP